MSIWSLLGYSGGHISGDNSLIDACKAPMTTIRKLKKMVFVLKRCYVYKVLR